MNNYSINHLAISRTRPATGRPDLVDGIDDLEAETIWGRDHYSIGEGNHPKVIETWLMTSRSSAPVTVSTTAILSSALGYGSATSGRGCKMTIPINDGGRWQESNTSTKKVLSVLLRWACDLATRNMARTANQPRLPNACGTRISGESFSHAC